MGMQYGFMGVKGKKKKGKVVPVLGVIKHYTMKAYGGVDV
jgi:hypothetical protein